MPGLIIRGQEVAVPGLTVQNFRDNPILRRAPEDGRMRTQAPSIIVVHTTKGIPGGSNRTPQTERPGTGPDLRKDEGVARWWSLSDKQSGAHLVVDADGSIGCLADLATETAYHAGQRGVNQRSIGIELYQFGDGSLYESTVEAGAKLIDFLCVQFGIQRQFHWPYSGPIDRLSKLGGRDVVGVVGHRDITDRRGQGDPGDIIFERLVEEDFGFDRFNFDKGEDREIWRQRQRDVGAHPDGIPGPKTHEALIKAGYRSGQWTLWREYP